VTETHLQELKNQRGFGKGESKERGRERGKRFWENKRKRRPRRCRTGWVKKKEGERKRTAMLPSTCRCLLLDRDHPLQRKKRKERPKITAGERFFIERAREERGKLSAESRRNDGLELGRCLRKGEGSMRPIQVQGLRQRWPRSRHPIQQSQREEGRR